jgi:hypothetical protein
MFFSLLRGKMSNCVTCGTALHPERAAKYNYCMARECQEKNAKGLTIAVVGMNKAAEEFVILDDRTKADLASGRYHDQRRGSFGTSEPSPAAAPAAKAAQSKVIAAPAPRPVPKTRPPRPRPAATPARKPWSRKQEKLALLYNEQGLRPAEIASKLGVSSYLVSQIILAAKNRGKI